MDTSQVQLRLSFLCLQLPAFGVASQSWISLAKAGYANARPPASNSIFKKRAAQ